PLSARSPGALRDLAGAYHRRLSEGDGAPLRDICHTAGARRTHHEWRAAAVGADRGEVARALRQLGSGGRGAGAARAASAVPGRPRVAFVFPGQGWETPGMARELLATNDAFARSMARCDAAIRAESGWSVRERLIGAAPLEGI